jgi:DNA-directed RNA polymerase specialized sigma24 family protein
MDMPTHYDETLAIAMGRYARGDDDAFGVVCDLLLPRLLRFFSDQGLAVARCEDLAEATLLDMHRSRRWYSEDADVEAWALALARRAVTAELRERVPRESVLYRAFEVLRTQFARRQTQTARAVTK